ncbi:AlpA family phage regulatory protein [Mariprofundus sp. KV]|nr:AlpA family phage regulatory protein [Mariprofundus sp. KV]
MKHYLRADQIAESLSVSTSTVWRWVKVGKLPQPFRPTQRTTLWEASVVQKAVDQMSKS